ncbi:ribose-5-phosphate isomerase A [Ligilactobacillus sp. WILCCON 0076]|uniref:ribose-5-phosphate isomerase n=1 Tax=Ligilactobacillus ubinensis TaxID=2876789 RepID=A0A9X2FK18_9LACO|nr:ribose-5-phosphate isomerase A [Ligilactobacillus ubinensis]MCP0887119.1 ribose-5-phosphate isomerase A [Ligilactobacillus ubinensis]
MDALIKEAVKLIKPNMKISLGGGSNVAKLASALAKENNLNLTICTPSEITKKYCNLLGMQITSIAEMTQIDLAFDGCDSLDMELNALKSNGGIHLFEKVVAKLADRYIILTPLERVTEVLNPKVPLTIEITDVSKKVIQHKLEELALTYTIRTAQNIAGYARTPSGNLLIDCYAENWNDIASINATIAQQNGVVATSFFENMVTGALTFDKNGKIRKFRKED